MSSEKPRSDTKGEAQPKTKRSKTAQHVTFYLERDLVERCRDAAWWTRRTLAKLAAEALEAEIKRLKRDENKGQDFPKRKEQLKGGPRG